MTFKETNRGIVALAGAGALGLVLACASPPTVLEEARQAYEQASEDPQVAQNAAVPLYEAKQTLQKAEHAWDEEEDRAETAHLAGLAKTHVEIARARAQRAEAEQEVETLTEERERVRLEARTREVDVALGAADRARLTAEQERQRARELEESLRELQAQQTDRGLVLTLGDVLFAFDRAELKPGAMQNLGRLVQFLRENPERQLLIEGHTDSVGSDAYNRDLSRRRAEAVRTYLVSSGIAPDRIVARGYGEAYPRVSNESDAGRQMNRRVEVVILEPGASPEQHTREGGTPAVSAGP